MSLDNERHTWRHRLCDTRTIGKLVIKGLQKCKEALAVISSVEKSITSRSECEITVKPQTSSFSMSIDEVFAGADKFIDLAYEVSIAIRNGHKRDISNKATQLCSMCRCAEEVLMLKLQD